MVSHHIAGRLTGQVYWERSEERRVGKDVKISVDLGGRRIIKKKNKLMPEWQQNVKQLLEMVLAVISLILLLSLILFLIFVVIIFFFFFKQKTAYEISECDWSSDVCSSDLHQPRRQKLAFEALVRLG